MLERQENIPLTEFTFAQVEAVLARQFIIASPKRAAFRSRIKALQKYGVPSRPKQGRGVPSTFSSPHLMQLALAVELTNSGLAPQVAAEVVLKSWDRELPLILGGLKKVGEVLGNLPRFPNPADIIFSLGWAWQVDVENLSDLMDPAYVMRGSARLEAAIPSRLAGLTGVLEPADPHGSIARCIVINASAFFLSFCYSVDLETRCSTSQMVDEFADLELGLGKVAELWQARLEALENASRDSMTEKEFANEFGDQLGRQAKQIISQYDGQSASYRALSVLISPLANEEIGWALTSTENRWWRERQTGEVLDRRKEGQRQLAALGLIEEPEDHVFEEPIFTEYGQAFLKHLGLADNVHTQA